MKLSAETKWHYFLEVFLVLALSNRPEGPCKFESIQKERAGKLFVSLA